MGLIARQTLKASVVNYAGVAVGFINVLFIMTLVFTEKEIGIIKMLTENMVLLAGFSMLGITTSMFRYHPHFKNDPSGKMHGFDFWSILVPFVGFLALCLTVILSKGLIITYFDEKASEFLEYYLLLLPLAFTQIFFSVFEAAAAIESRIVVPKLLKEVVLRVLTAFAFFCYYFGWLSFNQSVLLLVAFYFLLLVFIIAYFSRLRKFHFKPDFAFIKANPKIVKDFFGYTSLVTVGSISGFLLTKLDMIMISAEMGLDHTGVYVIAFQVATIIEIPRRALVQILSPKISENMKEGLFVETESLFKRTSVLLYIAGLILLMGLMVNLDNLFQIIPNGQNYMAGKFVIVVIAISKCIEMIGGVGNIIVLYSRFYYIMFLMTVGTTIFGVYLNLWLIPIHGILGAAYATGITVLIQQLIIIFAIYGKLKIHSFTMPLFWLTLLFGAVFGINYFVPVLPNVWLDMAFRSIVFPGLFVALVYFSKLSPETNQLIVNIIKRVKSGNFKPY